DQEDAALLGTGVALGDVGLADTQRLHLRAGELDAGLVGVADGVLVACLAVLGDALAAVVLLGRHRGPVRPVRRATRRPWPGSRGRLASWPHRPCAWSPRRVAPAAAAA